MDSARAQYYGMGISDEDQGPRPLPASRPFRESRQPDLAGRLLAIGRECAAHLKEPHWSVDHGELLYDEKALPK